MGIFPRFRAYAMDHRAASALEFALVLALMVTILFGGFEISEAAAIRRTVTITTRTVTDLVTQTTDESC